MAKHTLTYYWLGPRPSGYTVPGWPAEASSRAGIRPGAKPGQGH